MTTTKAVLHEPAHQVCPRAVGYWRAGALIELGVLVVLTVAWWVLLPHPWWGIAIAAVLLVTSATYAAVMPSVRFRVHRWEVTPTAVYTRAGWIGRQQRIAPLSRVQTVDSQQSAFMRPFRLASITVTTASAAGPITIACLDQDDARRVVHELVEITGATEGDAT